MDYQWQTTSFAELTADDLYGILRLRQEVFVVEQRCIYQDLDDLDQQAMHMLCRREGRLMAYQRCLAPGLSYRESSLGRIVVDPAWRGLQLGKTLVQRGIRHNLQHWPHSDIRINAQAYLQQFYSALGFITGGDEYLEDGIPHRQMLYLSSPAKTLPQAP